MELKRLAVLLVAAGLAVIGLKSLAVGVYLWIVGA